MLSNKRKVPAGLRSVLLLSTLLLCSAAMVSAVEIGELQDPAESVVPDLYAKTGDGSRARVDGLIEESINPYNGLLSISHTDIVVPGNGGLDITIQRHYNSLQQTNSALWAERYLGVLPPSSLANLRRRLAHPFCHLTEITRTNR